MGHLPLPPKDLIAAPIIEKTNNQANKSPYKFLNHYEEQDVDIFFGRNLDTIYSIRKLLSSKLMILYGKSGYGKTSLILAGVVPRLVRSGYLPIYARCTGDPMRSVKMHIIDHLRQAENHPYAEAIIKLQNSLDLSIADFIRELKLFEKRSLVVFIDQFEEFFISLGEATRKLFTQELNECINSSYIDLTFLLALREDFLAELNEIKELRNIFENSYRLKALESQQATMAIQEPASMFNITYENGLVEIITQELSEKGQIDPAQLQIVCDRLYNSLPKNTTVIEISLYKQLNGVKQILTDYVDSILDTFGPKRRSIAQKILRGMVTSWFTRISLRYSDIALETAYLSDWSENNQRELLNDLVKVRLIRRLGDLDEETYELTHEYLINKIRDWIDLETLKVKEAQDLLRQAFDNWQRHRIAMDKSALLIIDAQRDRLTLMSNLNAFILTAAITYDFAFEYWIRRNVGNAQAITMAQWLLHEDEPAIQRLAGIALGLLTKEQATIEDVYSTYEDIANPSTCTRMENLVFPLFILFRTCITIAFTIIRSL